MTALLGDVPGLKDQRDAADPAASVWVMANAGSGKTRVLTDRVTRLLLARTRPNAILCLTFTKAAAAEMANRLHQRLGQWAVLPNEELRIELVKLLGRRVDDDELAFARQLFARTLDCPGKLRIQTIHAFCESLLKRFPLESGVPPHFAIADDNTAAQLLEDARERLLARAASDERLAEALAFVVSQIEEAGFRGLMMELVGQRRRLRSLLAAHCDDLEAAIAATWRALDVRPDDTPEKLYQRFMAGLAEAELRRAASALDQGSATDNKRATDMLAWLDAPDRADRIDSDWCKIFLTDTGLPRNTLITQKAQKADPDALAILQTEQGRTVELRARLKALNVAHGTSALLRLGKALIDLYDDAKAARALLDYDDLILRAGELLRRGRLVSWVLFKLDGGIDHVLVDEAQDTSPEQWDVIAALTAEFFAGRGAHERPRTVFAVGDGKQSIFSFQGADPDAFVAMRAHFAERVMAAGQIFRPVGLAMSFRSGAAVLAAVDAIFSRPAARDGVGTDEEIRHLPYRKGMAGRVELWPPVVPRGDDPGDPWDAPLDYMSLSSPAALLARRIAGTIRRWLDEKEPLESRGRPIRPGDILILVRKRDAFFEEMVRALKAADVPVAGADRMVLAEQLAVMDLLALARFSLLPEDELTLATVLKGPLFNFDDDDLFELCWGRERRLWPTLRARAGERPHWRRAAEELAALLARTDYIPPFDFFAGILGPGRGRERLLARLGHEAADPIDEFLAAALAYERQHPPTLQGFLSWFESGRAEVKRDMEQGRDETRVMTVHGAKGLEANIVFLPDTCTMPDGRNDPKLLWTAGSPPLALWPIRSGNDERLCTAARDAGRQNREREYRRLLYVAATRARDRLYICGWQGERRPDGCWYDLIAPAVEGDRQAQRIELPWGETGWRIADRQAGTLEAEGTIRSIMLAASALPAWARHVAPAEPAPPRPLVPSRPLALEPLIRSPLGEDDGLRFKRGRLIHRLLQTLPDLPAEARAEAARRFLARKVHALTPDEQAEISRETLAVLSHADFAPLFAASGVAEAPVVGRLGSHVLSGQIDRIVVTDGAVFVLDYKTNRPPPVTPAEVPAVYLAQMASYRAALASLYPDRPIRCALIWTDGPRLMELPPDLLDAHAPN